MSEKEKNAEMDDLFDMLPEGTRIIIRGNKVTFENLPPELLDVALSLNPEDNNLIARKKNATENDNASG